MSTRFSLAMMNDSNNRLQDLDGQSQRLGDGLRFGPRPIASDARMEGNLPPPLGGLGAASKPNTGSSSSSSASGPGKELTAASALAGLVHKPSPPIMKNNDMTDLNEMNNNNKIDHDNELCDGTSMVHSSNILGTDSGEDEDFEIPQRFTKSGRKKATPFPMKLMKVLCQKQFREIITWLPDGKSFTIVRPKAFVNEILPQHFKQAKYSSFTRKLHRWGFQRHLRGEEAGAFFHKSFQRGRLDLVEKMTCYKVDGKLSAVAMAKNQVPSPGRNNPIMNQQQQRQAGAANGRSMVSGPVGFSPLQSPMQQHMHHPAIEAQLMQEQMLMRNQLQQQQQMQQQMHQQMQQHQQQQSMQLPHPMGPMASMSLQQQTQNQNQFFLQQQQQPQQQPASSQGQTQAQAQSQSELNQNQNQRRSSNPQQQESQDGSHNSVDRLNAAIELEVSRRLKQRMTDTPVQRHSMPSSSQQQQQAQTGSQSNQQQQALSLGHMGGTAGGISSQAHSMMGGIGGNGSSGNNNNNNVNSNTAMPTAGAMNMGMGNNFMNWNPTNNPAAVAAAAGAPTNMPFGLNLFGVGSQDGLMSNDMQLRRLQDLQRQQQQLLTNHHQQIDPSGRMVGTGMAGLFGGNNNNNNMSMMNNSGGGGAGAVATAATIGITGRRDINGMGIDTGSGSSTGNAFAREVRAAVGASTATTGSGGGGGHPIVRGTDPVSGVWGSQQQQQRATEGFGSFQRATSGSSGEGSNNGSGSIGSI